ncbi:MAG TPA: DNA methylase, partial [Cyanobacteria bacterium UBA8156]|nr:DNA methylase [Cyanobacteria bacterium UBA8156]
MPEIVPFALKDASALIERLLPASKISAEAQKERKAGAGQTLTALGSYWKGRKPLILAKACVLGALLPATADPEADLEVFELLMGIDDESFKRRLKSQRDLAKLPTLNYLQKLELCKRPEECDDAKLYGPVWQRVNQHLGTNAHSFPELVEQLGILRFGHRPRVADTFCGSGQIPFEAARLGCDVYASDLNPIACMLTWGALNIVGADKATRKEIEQAQKEVAEAVDREITALGIEHDDKGNRAKAYLYCLETRCPQTGWMVPMAPSWVISKTRNVVAKLIPNWAHQRFKIDIVAGVSEAEMVEAAKGTVQKGDLVYTLEGEEYRTPIKTLRSDYRMPDGTTGNKLRRWDKHDFVPRPNDIFQERLYCIQWITAETLGKSRQETFFASVTLEDLVREQKVEAIVRENLPAWQEAGLVPDMAIEPGEQTTRLGRERGWTYWHHLFSARQLLLLSAASTYSKKISSLLVDFCKVLDYSSKLCQWTPGSPGRPGVALTAEKVAHVFYNQALNPFFTYAERSSCEISAYISRYDRRYSQLPGIAIVQNIDAQECKISCDYGITDPPYADAVEYHEITEFFIAWLRKNPPKEFADWVWDSRRALAIKGSGEDFRRGMIAAYTAMATHMPNNGLQIVMFTHQDAAVWSDMASIVWGAGLQVTAAWYIATETTSELKKGGYVQGTVLLVLRKRLQDESAYRDELVAEVRQEVAQQIETMVGLNQTTKGKGRTENLFEDADLQMAGYAAALRVLTGYRHIDGQDMAAAALRPRIQGENDSVRAIIDYAVQVANEYLVPEGIAEGVWERCSGAERFYLKMLELEALGLKKLDNYQNFAKAYRVERYGDLMASQKPNDARLKNAKDFKKAGFEGDFGKSALRAVLFAFYELQEDLDSDEVMAHLRELVPGYHLRRDDLMAFCQYSRFG